MNRMPAVAGQFYPGKPADLLREVENYTAVPAERTAALGVVVPHAGYLYSGAIAGKTFARVHIPRKVIILGPNHHGVGPAASVYAAGAWQTPLGMMPIDAPLAGAILAKCPGTTADMSAHRLEHSLEVQVPFLQVLTPECSIVPICLGRLALTELLLLGEHLGRVLTQFPEEVLIVASSDMTHYEAGAVAREKDQRALKCILDLDPEGLYRTVRDGRISMCGVIPVVVMLAATLQKGARSATLVHYGNSGDITGDQSEVVGYAGVIVV
ncbi:AmmeMemoRadiSam system protein B [Trichloromonas sp.]|uniref:AmmeMemoRadiSam system protein B n=1 Tax=Trichloromonas sp. TaxID=3069249 RepID=UPI003D81537D